MTNLKLDIEDKLWAYLESEDVYQMLYLMYILITPKDRADHALQNCRNITDELHPVSKLCFDIAARHTLPVEIKIFEGERGLANHIMGCISDTDFLYFYFQPRILDQLDFDEISHIVEHELGHYFYSTKVSPEEMFSLKILNLLGLADKDKIRITTLAFLLAHISEFNADRFAVFTSKNIHGYNRAMKKLYDKELQRNSDPKKIDEIIKLREHDWKLKFLLAHPIIEDRAAALNCLEKYIDDTDFDINKTPDVYNKMLELLNYKEFMQEYGEYYGN
jgi:hypothetical protein